MNDYRNADGRIGSLSTHQGTPVAFNGNIQLSSTTAKPKPKASKVRAEEWFEQHKLLVFCMIPVFVVFVIVLLFRCCCKKEKKQPPKININDRKPSVLTQKMHLPRLRKSQVQPRPSGKREIKELGKVEYSLKYDYQRTQLNVKVISGKDFPLLSSNNVSFTYVVVELRPFSQKYEAKAQTRYVRNSISPVFNDVVKYQIPVDELDGQVLCLSVYDINHLSAHDLIGCVKVKVDGKSLTSGSERFYVEKVKWDEEISRPAGEILVGLCWKNQSQILELVIQEASSLRIMDEDKQISSPYVKVEIFVNSLLVLKKRTKVVKRTLNPKFKKMFTVRIPPDCIFFNTQIILTVKHVGKFRKKQVIGQLYLGNDAKDTVLEQWRLFRNNENYVEMWHQLDESVDRSLLRAGSKLDYLLFHDDNSDEGSYTESSDRPDGRTVYDGSTL